MTPLRKILGAGFAVKAVNGKLLIAPAHELTASRRAFIRQHKAELLAELTAANDELATLPLDFEILRMYGYAV